MAVSAFCAVLLRLLERSECALEIAYVGPLRMRRLNRAFRGKDRETDVLSFAYGEALVGEPPNLGTVVIAPSVALSNARRRGGEPEREMRTLLAHGILHLLGYDHERDNGEMRALQGRLLRRRCLADLPPVWGNPR